MMAGDRRDLPAQPDEDALNASETVLNPNFYNGPSPRVTPLLIPKVDMSRAERRAIDQVGRYRILERLGQGGMATVYKAFDPEINRAIAIKFLDPVHAEDDNYRGRFLSEAKAVGVLSHPNIVTVYDVGEINGQPYIAMEMVEGAPLSDVLSGGKPMST